MRLAELEETVIELKDANCALEAKNTSLLEQVESLIEIFADMRHTVNAGLSQLGDDVQRALQPPE